MKGDRADFFSKAEKEQIKRAVAEAEKLSSGEIVPMVVPASERYREAEQLGALLLSGLLAMVVAILIRHATIWSYIPLVGLFFFPVLFLFRRFPRLKLSFVGRLRQSEAVRERAMAAFYHHGLHRTREETGILIFISLLERKVWILADRGINDRIDDGYWRRLAGELAAGIRGGRSAEALCHTIACCGDKLALHFPRRDDDRNELPDSVISKKNI